MIDDQYSKDFKDKVVLITGGTGSIGTELVRQVLKYEPTRVKIYSRDENKQYELMEALGHPQNLNLLIGDIKDKERLIFALKGVDIVLHAAAMKHVAIGEYNPFEVVKTNIIGSQNVIDAAIAQKVKKVIGISTDKAVNPTSVLGVSKLMMEKLFINANNYTKKDETKFACVRFGNIAWSRGSVLPSWKAHAEKDKVIKLTNKEMTRFFMSKEEAIELVLKATALTQGGELFTFQMHAISLSELAKLFLEKYYQGQDIAIEVVGARQGEKLHEELFDAADLAKQVFTDGQLFILIPHFRLPGLADIAEENKHYPGFTQVKQVQNVSSAGAIDVDKIKSII